MEFEDWKALVAKEVVRICGLSPDDLPDWEYWEGWESGMKPEEAAKEVVQEAGFPAEGDEE